MGFSIIISCEQISAPQQIYKPLKARNLPVSSIHALELVIPDREYHEELLHELQQRRLAKVSKHGKHNFQRAVNHFKMNVNM